MAIANSPVDLNQYIDHVPILQSLEITVKDHLPTTVTCPFCSKPTLGIFVIPTVGGRWYYCSECGFRGDSIELYHRAHKLPDIKDAIYELVAKQILPQSRDQVQLDAVNKYLTTYVTKRKEFEALFETAQNNLKDVDKTSLALLHEMHLWGGYRAGHWHKYVSDYMGIMHPKEARAFGIDVPRSSNCRRLVVMPCYDIPGRICSLVFYGFNRAHFRAYVSEDEDGLMMLDTLPLHSESVIALSDPAFALQLQRRQFNRTSEPLPIIVYGTRTHRGWQSVVTRRVIFWSQDDPFWLYSQALMHPKAHIASRPQFDDAGEYIQHTPLSKILSQFNSSAQSWAASMKQLILEGDHWQVCDFVLNMNLSMGDMQRIYNVCSPSELQRVKRALGEVALDRFVQMGGMRISESDDCWWIINKDQRELACGAVIRLDAAIHVPDADENYYEGAIISKGKQVHFCEKMDIVEKNTAIWLRDVMMRNGMSPPIVHQKVKPHLVAIAKQFQEPQYVQRSGKVGWNAEVQGFVFPNFTVRYGAVDDSSRAMVYDVKVPAAKLTAGSIPEGDWDDMMAETPEAAALWAGLTCFMMNLMAPVLTTKPTPVGFIGGSGSVAREAGLHLAKELDMVTLTPKKPRLSLVEIMEHERTHGYPLWLDIAMAKRTITMQLHAAMDGNFMMDVLEGEAAALAIGDGWTFVRAPMIASQGQQWPHMSGIVRYLAWLQSNSFSLQPATSLHMSILYSLREWADLDIGMANQNVFRMAENMLMSSDKFTMEQRLLHLIFWLQMNGDLKMEEREFYDEFTAGTMAPCQRIVVDPEAKKVYVSMRGIRAGIRSAKLPSPDFDEAVKHAMAAGPVVGFEMGAECFVLNYPYWANELQRWMKLRT